MPAAVPAVASRARSIPVSSRWRFVGSGALGYEVAQGLQRNEFGLGVVASLAILALGIALDRVTQGNRRKGRDV